jgi:hypothetical protein
VAAGEVASLQEEAAMAAARRAAAAALVPEGWAAAAARCLESRCHPQRYPGVSTCSNVNEGSVERAAL